MGTKPTVEELLEKLGFQDKKKEVNEDVGETTIYLTDSADYAKAFTILSNSDLTAIQEEKTLITEEVSQFMFESEFYMLKLISNFKDDNYRILIKEEQE